MDDDPVDDDPLVEEPLVEDPLVEEPLDVLAAALISVPDGDSTYQEFIRPCPLVCPAAVSSANV